MYIAIYLWEEVRICGIEKSGRSNSKSIVLLLDEYGNRILSGDSYSNHFIRQRMTIIVIYKKDLLLVKI